MLRVVIALCLVGAAVCGPPVSRTREEIEKFRDYLESTRTENGVQVGEKTLNPDEVNWVNSGKYQGDIMLDDEQVESMVEQFAQGRNGYIWPGTHWPHRVVVYEFYHGFSQAQKDYIYYTMRVIEERTCIRFRHRYAGEHNYVLITNHHGGCWATVGYWYSRGQHGLNLQSANPGQGCFGAVIIIHEWLHVIGFFHMQSTYNRYDYVRINWHNMMPGTEHNFDRYDNNMVSNLGLPYEYDSCMHYFATAFSHNGHPTIEPTRHINVVMGQQDYVTGYDFWRVDRLYGCQHWRQQEDYPAFHKDDAEKDFPAFQAELRAKEAAGQPLREEPEPILEDAEETVQVQAVEDQLL